MTEFSSIVVIQTNEAGQPTNLVAFSEGDTIASSVLSTETQQVLSAVEDSSASWDAGLDSDTYNNIVDVSTNFASFSGDIQTSTRDLETSTRGISSILDASVGSGLDDVCAYITAEETNWNSGGSPSATGFENWNNTYDTVTDTSADYVNASSVFNQFSGDMQASTRDLEVSTRNLSSIVDDFSGALETSTRNMSSIIREELDVSVGSGLGDVCAYITAEETSWNQGGDPSATGFENWNNTYDTVTDTSADYVNASSVFNQFSGDMQASTRNLEASTRNLSGILDSSTNFPNTLATNLEVSTRNLSGILDSSTNFPNTLATNLEASAIASSFADQRIGLYNANVSIATGKRVVNDASNASLSLNNQAVIASANLAVRFDGQEFVFEEDGDLYERWSKNDFRNTKIVSGDVITSLRPFSGAIETSARNIETSTRNMSSIVGTFSGDVEGSVGTIDSDITTLQGQVPSAAGFSNWNTIYGDRNNIRSVSGSVAASDTAFLNGATPTLTNDLDVNNNDIFNVKTLSGAETGVLDISGKTVILTSPEGGIRLGSVRTDTATWTKAGVEKSFSAYDYSLSSWLTVKDNSGSWGGGGGGGDFEGSAIASGVFVANGSSVDFSGADGTTIDNPTNGMVLVLDTADEKIKYSKISGPQVVPGGITGSELATGAVTEDKIADDEISSAKLKSGAAEGAIAANGLGFNKLTLVGATTLVGNSAGLGGPMNDLSMATVRTMLNVADGATANTGALADKDTIDSASLLDDSVVSLGKIADIADDTILGNQTGGAAAPVALTAAQARGILNVDNGATQVRLYNAGFSGTGSIPTTTNSVVVWDLPSLNQMTFDYDDSTGVFTVDANTRARHLEFNIMVGGDGGSARVELNLELQKDTGSGFAAIAKADNYAVRISTQDEGGCWLNFIDPVVPNTGDKYRVTLRRVGGGLNFKALANFINIKQYG